MTSRFFLTIALATAIALACVNDVSAQQPNDSGTHREAKKHYDLAIENASRGNDSDAVRECREAVRLDPDFAVAHYELGLLLARTGQGDEAISEIKESLRLD